MATNRRQFLKSAGAIAAAGMSSGTTGHAASDDGARRESWGMLIDLTLCIGCRKCEFACRQVNGLRPRPIDDFEDKAVFDHNRRIDANELTVVNRYESGQHEEHAERGDRAEGEQAREPHANTVYVKTQCMHCNEPACASACPVGAIRKTPQGPVIYRERTCIGCRYCMMACPFSMLAYTYDNPVTPVVRKCTMCFDAVSGGGGPPACARICPVEAITFGTRGRLLALARERIQKNPDKYVDHVYGEHEVGGTSVLYIGPKPFEQMGFRTDLGTTSCPERAESFMSLVPLVISIWPAVLLGAYLFSRSRHDESPLAGHHQHSTSVAPGNGSPKQSASKGA